MFELMRHDPEIDQFEAVYVFDKLEDAFKEAYFNSEEITWQYYHEDNQVFFWEGYVGDQVGFLIRPAGVETPHTAPPEEEMPMI